MKKRVVLIMLIAGMVLSSVVYAEDSAPGSLAIGVHGEGGEWNTGRPTLRWKASDQWAFDFTPVISIDDVFGHDNDSMSNANDNSKSNSYGLNVGAVRNIKNVGGLSIGWRAEIGFIYSSYEHSNDTIVPSIGTGSSTSHERRQFLDLGFGPDLEYFVPSVPGLSLGASAQIHYSYMSDHYRWVPVVTGGFTTSGPHDSTVRQNRLTLLGELLTIRYYY